MTLSNRKRYYTYDEGAVPRRERADAPGSQVIYTPERVREVLGGEHPAVLVMGRAAELDKAASEARHAGMRPVCAYADADVVLAAKAAVGIQDLVRIGEAYSEGLFSNAHAVLEAAGECGARAIVLCGESRSLSSVDAFLTRADHRRIAVFSRQGDEASSFGWVRCETPQKARECGPWLACPKCGLQFDEASMAKRHYECPSCGGYFRLTSTQRIRETLDEGSFVEWDGPCEQSDPLAFPGYLEKVAAQSAKTGFDEAVRTGSGSIGSTRTALAVMESSFFMGSMGSSVGARLSAMFDRATEEGLPAVVFCASGGARMQEGLVSLMQMAKVSCAVRRHADAGLLYVSVLTDPTTGGVTASFAMQGDVIIAEPHALIGFAGRRVIQDTIRQKLPDEFQTAEFALEHGLIDAVVPRGELRETLANVLALHNARQTTGEGAAAVLELSSFDTVRASLKTNSRSRNRVTLQLPGSGAPRDSGQRPGHRGPGMPADAYLPVGDAAELGVEAADLPPRKKPPARYPFTRQDDGDAWKNVLLARDTHRPTSLRYLEGLVDGFVELHGDRAFGDDASIVAGIGWIGSTPVTVIAQEKGSTLNERLRRNFGCPQPEGYRKSLRLMRQAEKFGRPIVCLVDTQGAFCGVEAEERGQGNAIADNLEAMASLRVPIVSVLLGEGGSGGALALALANRVGMQEHAVYSVLSPEGFASILWKDRSRAAEAAGVMKMDAASVHAMGIVDDVIAEGDEPAHVNPAQAVENVGAYVRRALRELADMDGDELVIQRHERFARF